LEASKLKILNLFKLPVKKTFEINNN
jgi:hypothetical protein